MAVQINNCASPSLSPVVVRSRRSQRSLISLPAICIGVLCIVAVAHAQTFQYSRGWTNGKRSGATGAVSPIGVLDMENGFLNSDDLGFYPGHIQMNAPQGRLRTLDYNQYLARKLGVGSSGNLNTRKQPLWFGTIMGMDSSDSSAPSSQTSSSSGSAGNPSGSTNDF